MTFFAARRSALAASIIIVLAGGLTACGSSTGDTAPATPEGPVDITFQFWVPNIDQAVDAYNASQDDVNVTLETITAGPDGGYAKTSTIVVNGVLVIAALYFLLPILWVLVAATMSPGELFSSFGLWFTDSPQAWLNLTNVFTQDGGIFTSWILNSILYSAVGAFAATILSAACGYAIAKFPFKGRELLFSIVLGGVLVPATVIALPLYFLLNAVDLTGTYWSVLLPSMVSPFGVYLARIHANAAVPDEIIEAARIDGAGDLRIFGAIASRMMTPALVTIFLFQFVAIWNNYLLPLVMLTETKTFPLTLGLTLWNSQTQRDPMFYQLVVTGSALSAVLLVALMIGLQRFWRADLTAGATKG